MTFYVTIHVTRQGKNLWIQQNFPTVPNYYESLTLRPPRTSTKVSAKRKISLHGLAHVNSILIDSPTLPLCLTSCRIFVNLDQQFTSLLKPHLITSSHKSSRITLSDTTFVAFMTVPDINTERIKSSHSCCFRHITFISHQNARCLSTVHTVFFFYFFIFFILLWCGTYTQQFTSTRMWENKDRVTSVAFTFRDVLLFA